MSYHFVGLGGIGMSALARILLQQGKEVQGSDLKPSALLDQLAKEGAGVHIGHRQESIREGAIVIYSTDIKEDNCELAYAKEKKMQLYHRSDLLHSLMQGKKSCLVTGTHGKTTTTALLASVLMEARLDPSFVIGGLLRHLNVNGRYGRGEYFVAEADESDGSFLKTAADYAIVTNLENDHLDYWGSPRMLDLAFAQFMAETGHLVWCADDPRLVSLKPKGVSYGFSEKAHYRLSHFRQTEHGILFDLNETRDIYLNLLGRHNALNGAAVFCLAKELQIPDEVIRRAFQTFSGTLRRLEWKGEAHKVSLFDDYGHHPREIAVTIKALRDHIQERRLIVVFQPHRYTRVRDLFDSFADCFEDADEVFLTDIYSAGESPIEGMTSVGFYTRLKEKLKSKLHFLPRLHLEAGVGQFLRPLDVVLTIGAGDITHAGGPILHHFANRSPQLKVGLLYGGASPEHPVSLMSASNIMKGLDPSVYTVKPFFITREGKWETPMQELMGCDVCIPVFHGPQGEDGMIGALLEAMDIPYVGCDFRSSALCMQKSWTKCVALGQNILTAPFFEMTKSCFFENPSQLLEQIHAKLSYPVWIKPVHLGSSIGVSRASNPEEAKQAASLACQYDDRIIVEQEVLGRQIEFAVLGNERLQIALPGEIVNHGAFVAYDKKYGAGAMEIRVPAEITPEECQRGRELAEAMYRACNCQGLTRVDFFLTPDGKYWLNELNPFPGFTDTSAYPKMWEKSGMSLSRLVDEMIARAFHRSRV
jgi:UDP-N-acetylmuramate--alanine ligase